MVDGVEVSSAGTEITRVHPLAREAVKEIDLSMDGHRSKLMSKVLEAGDPDLVITVCDSAAAGCPTLPDATRTIHWSLPDPSAATGTDEERLEAFRVTREELRGRIAKLAAAEGWSLR